MYKLEPVKSAAPPTVVKGHRFNPSLADLKGGTWTEARKSTWKTILQADFQHTARSGETKTKTIYRLEDKSTKEAKVGEQGKLGKESKLLEQLQAAGLRVARVFHVENLDNGRAAIYMKKIDGNLIDFKEVGFDILWALVRGALCGDRVPHNEASRARPLIAAMDNAAEWEEAMKNEAEDPGGALPTLAAIDTAIHDFSRLATFLGQRDIGDLQGIMSVKSGKFHIIDPTGIYNPGEKESKSQSYNFATARENVAAIQKRLMTFRTEAERVITLRMSAIPKSS